MVANSERNDGPSEQFTQNGPIPRRDHGAQLHFIQNKLKAFHTDLLNEVQERMSNIVNDLEKELRQQELQIHEFPNSLSLTNLNSFTNGINADAYEERYDRRKKFPDKTTDKKRGAEQSFLQKFPEKVFQSRESYLTTLMKVDHIRTIYNIFVVGFIYYAFQNILQDYFTNGRITLAANLFHTGFGNIHYSLAVWLGLMCYTCSVYYALKTWSSVRFKLRHHEPLQRMWSRIWLMAYIMGVILCLYLPVKACLWLDIKYASCAGLLMETLRMIMKQHAFVRTICGRVLQGKLKNGDDSSEKPVTMPGFGKYLYYLFAPTLMYQDNYPRTSHIRWKFVAARFAECVAYVLLFAFLYENHLRPFMENFGKMELSAALLIRTYFNIQLTAMLFLLSGFYFLLHSWPNFTAELLRFGDRMFYRDWWTSRDMFEYFRKWNLLVGDWLYEYVFKDFYRYVFKGNKAACENCPKEASGGGRWGDWLMPYLISCKIK
ncbi:sterol O-acyltransferase 1-like [Musca vetustissima]|uniref:sterol O-acyltransferase 1-like n=1 Tax=Musca vetustissima TaxID=27455 RepID=UPI002AB66C48|nr:sterol O-acyltransferase 1-like [Musca vetustissima]